MMNFRIFLRRLLIQFQCDRSGQVAFLGIAAALPLTLLMFYMVNSSKALQDSTRAQSAADMIALAHGAETARSMNVIAMNHVSLTQNFTTAVNASSLDNTLKIHRAILVGAILETGIYGLDTCRIYTGWFSFLKPVCLMPSLAFGIQLGLELPRVSDVEDIYEPDKALRVANNALKALNVKNEEIVNRFPEVIEKQAAWLAQTNKVSDLYIDNSCERGQAATCDSSNKRQGMELPLTKNEPMDAHLRFCAATFFGTGGVDLGKMSMLGSLGGLGNFASIPLMNGSFNKRGFDINRGPMYGGSDEDKYLPTHISKYTSTGQILKDYDELSVRPKLYDGVLNLLLSPINGFSIYKNLIKAQFAWRKRGKKKRRARAQAKEYFSNITDALVINGDSLESYKKGPGFKYPFDQELDDNIFTRQVNLRTAAQCIGGSDGGLGFLTDILSGLSGLLGFTEVADFDVYHAVQDGSLPKILPDLEDFDDDYKPLVFVNRKSNKRWSPGIFKDTTEGFVKYGQAVTFNPDEISIYSQNWQSRLIPSSKMKNLSDVLSRMETKSSDSFSAVKTDLQSVDGEGTWADVVVK